MCICTVRVSIGVCIMLALSGQTESAYLTIRRWRRRQPTFGYGIATVNVFIGAVLGVLDLQLHKASARGNGKVIVEGGGGCAKREREKKQYKKKNDVRQRAQFFRILHDDVFCFSVFVLCVVTPCVLCYSMCACMAFMSEHVDWVAVHSPGFLLTPRTYRGKTSVFLHIIFTLLLRICAHTHTHTKLTRARISQLKSWVYSIPCFVVLFKTENILSFLSLAKDNAEIAIERKKKCWAQKRFFK